MDKNTHASPADVIFAIISPVSLPEVPYGEEEVIRLFMPSLWIGGRRYYIERLFNNDDPQ
jgi:hypothetical protein